MIGELSLDSGAVGYRDVIFTFVSAVVCRYNP